MKHFVYQTKAQLEGLRWMARVVEFGVSLSFTVAIHMLYIGHLALREDKDMFKREAKKYANEAIRRSGRLRVELLCLGLGAAGIVIYQLMENCAIYYTGAGNVAILVAFGPIATAVMAKVLSNDKHLTIPFLVGSLIAVAGVAILICLAGGFFRKKKLEA